MIWTFFKLSLNVPKEILQLHWFTICHSCTRSLHISIWMVLDLCNWRRNRNRRNQVYRVMQGFLFTGKLSISKWRLFIRQDVLDIIYIDVFESSLYHPKRALFVNTSNEDCRYFWISALIVDLTEIKWDDQNDQVLCFNNPAPYWRVQSVGFLLV